MPNKSYDRYVELLRAAELQSYERTSAIFVAKVGAAATATSWLASNPIAALFSSLGVVAVTIVVTLSMWPDAKVANVAPNVAHRQTIEQPALTNEPLVKPDLKEITSIDQPFKNAFSNEQHETQGSTDHEMRETSKAAQTENNISEPTRPVSSADESEVKLCVVAPKAINALPSIEAAKFSMSYVLMPEVERSTEHSWWITFSMNSLPVIDRSYHLNFRASALQEVGSGFSLGIAAGLRSVSDSTSKFTGFKDTTIIIDEEESASKIGQFKTVESVHAFPEMGIVASYDARWMFGSLPLSPVLSIFAGLEGRTVVLEQSLSLNWLMADRLAVFGGMSLREYPAQSTQPQLHPLAGFRVGL